MKNKIKNIKTVFGLTALAVLGLTGSASTNLSAAEINQSNICVQGTHMEGNYLAWQCVADSGYNYNYNNVNSNYSYNYSNANKNYNQSNDVHGNGSFSYGELESYGLRAVNSPAAYVSQGFHSYGGGQSGIDIGTRLGPSQQTHLEIVAPVSGKVVSSGYMNGWGGRVSIQLNDGRVLSFNHISTDVSVGQYVNVGDHLGYENLSGNNTGYHLDIRGV